MPVRGFLDDSRTDVLYWCVPSTRDQRPYNVAYYQRNREAEIARVALRQRATLDWLRNLRRVPCMDCGGVFPPHVMDFDHRDPTQKSFSLAAEKVLLKNRKVLEAEVAKCDVICANCHRIRTALQYASGILDFGFKASSEPAATPLMQRRREQWHRRRGQQMDVLIRLRQLPCADCGRTFPVCAMEFDHRPGLQKIGLVSQMAGRVTIRTLLEEVAKCDIVCTNCHRDRSYRRRFAIAGVAQLEEHEFSKLRVAGSSPVSRSASVQLPLIEESRAPYHVAA
jgi:hypothetical protein